MERPRQGAAAPGARLYLAYLVEPADEGRRAPRAPAHITLVPPFAAEVATALAALEAGIAGERPFAVRLGERARFGPRGDVPVVLVGPASGLRRLHERLMAALAERGAGPEGSRHVHDGFVPHITLRHGGGGLPRGRELVIDHVALVRSGDGATTVLATRGLGDAAG